MHLLKRFTALVTVILTVPALASSPAFVSHDPGAGVFSQSVTQRTPELPREGDAVELWVKIGPSFSYDSVAVYYTTDGSNPSGSRGIPNGTTNVLLSFGPAPEIIFQFNEQGVGGNDDWWRADMNLVTRLYGQNVRYTIGAWDAGTGDPEIFANGSPATIFDYDVLLAWPGAGSNAANPSEGYPPLHFWKEEAVVGNNYINVMLDQNGAIYDVYYPSAGAVNGVSTKNEGYSDGGKDQFPLFLNPDQRGQMHLNQAFIGLRPTSPVNGTGTTYWLTNANGTDFADVQQVWTSDDTNVVQTSQRLVATGLDLSIVQTDFAPKGIAFPTYGPSNTPNRGLYVKIVSLTNNAGTDVELNAYLFADWALNGGDQFDGTFTDAPRGAMVAFDNTYRLVNAVGEYNPTTFSDYEKNASVYLAAAMKVGANTPATDFWSDTSGDQGLGWVGSKITVPAGQTREFTVCIAGGFDSFAGATGTYNVQTAPALDWFINNDMATMASTTEAHWQSWLAGGVGFDCPEPVYNELFKRGLLGTALHLDGKNGGIIAGMHNGAYPYVWPRDAAWAAITLARTGHVDDAKEIYRFLRDIAFRDVEGWGRKGFWKQKYTTDGFTIWGTPQVDETSCFPWGIRYIFDVTGDLTLLEDNYDEVFDAAIASSTDSTIDNRLRYEESVDLVYSMNLWEDSFDVFNYSNASVIRGLEDAAIIANILDQNVCPGGPGTCGYHTDAASFTATAGAIRGGLDARLAWNGENTDISQLGITYPFEIYPPGHPRVELVMDRINGVASDTFGNFQPLVNFGGEWNDLINRYWNDTYWNNTALTPNPNGSPWFLTTLWYGTYYAKRQDLSAGTTDIDNHKYRIDLLLNELGPMGFGAEQIASNNTLKYPGQTDYRLQTAYPNAWESMSFLTDAIMMFLDYRPDAFADTLRVRPKLPSAWSYMEYDNITLGSHRLGVRVEEDGVAERHIFTNATGPAADFDTALRVPASPPPCGVTVNGAPVAFTFDAVAGTVEVTGALATGAGATTTVEISYQLQADFNMDDAVTLADFTILAANFGTPSGATFAQGDANGDGAVTLADFTILASLFGATCP
jgi:GH15 family glucan-1,4-alpha-glucosidase